MTNTDLVMRAIPTDKTGVTVDELVEKTGITNRWQIIAIIILESAKLWPVHDPADPTILRWRRITDDD